MSYLCGCYFYHVDPAHFYQLSQYTRKQYLPLLDSEAHSIILSKTSRTVLKQTFTNPSPIEDIKECIYTFPLYDGVSVVGFTCQIGPRILTGLVKEKVKAQQIFDSAVAKGETAGLLVQAPEASDVFSTKLGNIPAGKSVIVEITYISELKHHETDGTRFTIPTSIAPRYGEGPFDSVYLGNHPIHENEGIKITVDINMPDDSFIKGVQSPSHPIAVSMGAVSTAINKAPSMSKASATLSLGSAALDKDFVLIIQSKDLGIPKAILETHPTIPNHRALMVTLVPKFTLPPSRPEIVFVADRSGSMSNNIPMLISAMTVFLKSMPVGVKFNICSFGSTNTFLWPQSKSYTRETLETATNHVSNFMANMGGTETFQAIKATIERRFTDLPLEIILLTDGDIWRQNDLFGYVNEQVVKTDGKIRVFPLGIGNGVSSALIEGLARAGNGFAQSVQNGERLDNSVVRMLRGALSPHITDYTLEVKYEKEDDDFELIEKVTDGMKVLLSDIETTKKIPENPKPTISLFDSTVNPDEDVKMQDAEFTLPNIPFPKLLQAPHKIPTLYPSSRTTVYLLMSPDTIQRNPTSVILRATSEHGPLALEIPIEALSSPAETIHQLAAKKAVQDLEEGRGWIFDAKDQCGILVQDKYPSQFDDLIQKEAVRLGEKFQVAGKWCSFVAVAENDAEIAEKHDTASGVANLDYDPLTEADGEIAYGSRSPKGMGVQSQPPQQSTVEESRNRNSRNAGPNTWFRKAKKAENRSVDTHSMGSKMMKTSPSPASPGQLQQYQMGLMMLEQQNKGRLTMERQSPALPPGGNPSSSFLPQSAQLSFQPMQMQMQQQMQQAQPSAFGSSVTPMTFSQGLEATMGSQHQALGMGVSSSPPSSTGSALFATPMGRQSPNTIPPQAPKPNASFTTGASSQTRFGNLQANSAPPPSAIVQPYTLQSQHVPSQHFGAGSRGGRGGVERGSFAMGSFSPRIMSAASKTNTFSRSSISGQSQPMLQTSNFDPNNPPLGRSVPAEPIDYALKYSSASPAEKVLALINLQDFEGSWPKGSEEITGILGFEIPAAPQGVDDKMWATLLVIAFLEIKNSGEEGVWELVVEKARGWLDSQQGGNSLAEFEKAARCVLAAH